jgi:deoxyribodipyrimidine photo-lyase
MKTKSKLVIFNQDLRIYDNPALFCACQKSQEDSQKIIPIFIWDEENHRPLGGASKWFLKYSLRELQKTLKEKLGLNLQIFKGDTIETLKKFCGQNKISEVYFNNLYEQNSIDLQNKIKKFSNQNNITVFNFSSYLLFEPKEIKNQQGSYFKVFTPFWKHCLKSWHLVRKPLNTADCKFYPVFCPSENQDNLDNFSKNNWGKKFENIWEFDRKIILSNFQKFLKNHLRVYQENRNRPDLNQTSKLSPYLHFGLVSVAEIIDLVKKHYAKNPQDKNGVACFLNEIGWREFSHHLLYHFPNLPEKNFKKQFDNFTWVNNQAALTKWQKGQTGFPIVDAAMQELWQTGFMQNRCRMITASFLIKDLLINWRYGEKWFWDCLIDASLANNCSNWQWVAGSGADASPYFRIFNPILQGEKFDPLGDYVKKYLPQLKNIPKKFIHKPWKLSKKDLEKYGVVLGKNYPQRIVFHEEARKEALNIYKTLLVEKNPTPYAKAHL